MLWGIAARWVHHPSFLDQMRIVSSSMQDSPNNLLLQQSVPMKGCSFFRVGDIVVNMRHHGVIPVRFDERARKRFIDNYHLFLDPIWRQNFSPNGEPTSSSFIRWCTFFPWFSLRKVYLLGSLSDVLIGQVKRLTSIDSGSVDAFNVPRSEPP